MNVKHYGIYIPINQGIALRTNHSFMRRTFQMKKYNIYKHIGNLSQLNNEWIKELNFISWDDREPVYDIRTWNTEHTAYGKGVTLTASQMAILKILLNEMTTF